MFVNFKCGFAEQALRALLFDHSPQSNRAPERLDRGPVPSRDAQENQRVEGQYSTQDDAVSDFQMKKVMVGLTKL